ncbi:hypothetical protein SEUCBS140593_006410 [Sporothrix eucalyptigena]|uniref:Pentatricopeptide repeat protein n=1 Tax=Sporothrix eucalyptigena TaxID=1812306 RepID=A0ABP0C6V3_9PEZI
MSRRVMATSLAVPPFQVAGHPTGSPARRRARRKAGISSMFTVGYATAMATVVAAEANRRVRHREDMGRRLDDAREALTRILHHPVPLNYKLTIGLPASSAEDWLPKGQQTVPAPTVENTPTTTSRNEVVEAIKSICVPPAQLLSHVADAEQRDAYLTWLHHQFGLQRRWWSKRPEPSAGIESIADAMLQEEIASQETLLEGQREPLLAVQFSRMVEATNRLVDSLIEEGHRIGSFGDPVAQKASMESLESPWHAMKLLRSDGYPNFRMPDLDPVATTTARLEANDAARRIFENWSQVRIWGRPRTSALDLALRRRAVSPEVWNAKEVKFWVAKLCYNMLVSPAPPGIHNYNILMLGFIGVEQHTLAQIVAESLLYDTRMLPTQQTLVCLLHQARAQGNVVNFHYVLRRLVALDSRGIKIRRRAIPDVVDHRTNREWARSNDVNLAGGYVVQRATIDGPVVEAIIMGLLSLDQVRHAAVVFSAYLNYCTKLNAATLSTILNPVLDAVDIPAARVLLRGLAKNHSLVTDMLTRRRQQKGKVQMEPQYAEQKEVAVDYENTNLGEENDPQADGNSLPSNPDELPELIYARKLYKEGKTLEKFQIKLLKHYGTTASSHLETADMEDLPYIDDAATAIMFNRARPSNSHFNYGSGIEHLSSALFVSEATQYLKRLSGIVKAAHSALQADEHRFAAGVDSWIDEFVNLSDLPQRHRQEQEVYRRMARLKAVDQTAEAVFAACSHVMESFMETITADLAATSAAAAAAEADAESEALQAKLSYSFMSIVKSFLQRTSVPFGLRLGTYLSTKQATQGANITNLSGIRENRFDADAGLTKDVNGWASDEFDLPRTLLETRFKEIILQSVFPEKGNSRTSLEESIALRRRARSMSLDALLEARLLLLEQGAKLQDKAPAPTIAGGVPERRSVEVEQNQDVRDTRESSGIFRMGAVFSN